MSSGRVRALKQVAGAALGLALAGTGLVCLYLIGRATYGLGVAPPEVADLPRPSVVAHIYAGFAASLLICVALALGTVFYAIGAALLNEIIKWKNAGR